MKKYFSLILLALLPIVANAYDAYIDGIWYNFSGNEAEVADGHAEEDESHGDYTYPQAYAAEVDIPATVSYGGVTYTVTRIGYCAFQNCINLTSVTIPGSVTQISGGAFAGCSNLTSIVIPKSVTHIGGEAFIYCENLASVTLSEGLTTIDEVAFASCSSLTSITIPKSVTSIGWSAFEDCENLKTVTIESDALMRAMSDEYIPMSALFGEQVQKYILGDAVTVIGNYAFEDCYNMTSITIGNGVTSIGFYAFGDCSNLTSINIPESVTSIGDCAFEGCSSLTSINIPNRVTSIGDEAFGACYGLTSIIIPESVTSIGEGAFSGCENLTSVTIESDAIMSPIIEDYGDESYTHYRRMSEVFGDQVETYILPATLTTIGDGVFADCGSLTSINIPNSVTKIGDYAFEGCSSLTSIAIPDGVTQIGDAAFAGCGLTSIIIPESVTSIGWSAFSDCENLKTVTIESDVINSPIEEYYDDYDDEIYAYYIPMSYIFGYQVETCILGDAITAIGEGFFQCCKNLTSVTIGNGVTSIGDEAFTDCSSLTSINIPNSVTSIGDFAFFDCSSLTSINIPNSVTTIGDEAFYCCSGLTSVTIGNGVTSIGDEAFFCCSDLTSVTIGNGVTSIGDEAFEECWNLTSVHIMDLAAWCGIKFGNADANPLLYAAHLFMNGEEITDLIIPDGVTSIGEYAFQYCSGLTSVTIPNSVTSIGYRSFYGCKGLNSVTIGNGVTDIGDESFDGCTSLARLIIGNSITSIGDLAFAGTALTDVYCFAENVPTTSYYDSAFSNCSLENATLYVPETSVEQYKATEPWSRFGMIEVLDVPKCATPTISYANGELAFDCETEAVDYITDITDTDIKKHYGATISLSATYVIKVYATKAGYNNSDVATATLCWIDAEPKSEGLEEDAVNEVKALPVLIQAHGGIITVRGLDAGTEVSAYSTSGMLLDTIVSSQDAATLRTSLTTGSTAIVKIGDRAIKVMVK